MQVAICFRHDESFLDDCTSDRNVLVLAYVIIIIAVCLYRIEETDFASIDLYHGFILSVCL